MIFRKIEHTGRIVSAALLVTLGVLLFFTAYQEQHWDSDIFWALESGEWITANLAVPKVDPFSNTFGGEPWIDFTWGFQVLAHAFFTWLGGWTGLFVLQLLILAGIFAALYANLRVLGRKTYWLAATALFLVFAGSHVRLIIRPHLPAYLLITVFLLLLTLFERSGRKRYLIALLPLQVLWVNLHSSFILGIFIVGAYAAGKVIDEFRSGGYSLRLELSSGAKMLVAVSVAIPVVSLINPYGLDLVVFPFVHQSADNADALRHIGEWQKLGLGDLIFDLSPTPVSYFAYKVLLLGAVASLALNRRKVRARDLILLAGAFYMAASHGRFVSQFCYFAAPILVANLSAWLEDKPEGLTAGAFWPVTVVTLLAAGVTVAGYAGYDMRRHYGIGVEKGAFPDVAVDFIRDEGLRGNLFNEYIFGGYIIHSLYPEVKPFIDPRTPTVYSPYFFWQARLVDDERHWRKLDEEYGFDMALIKPRSGHCSVLRESPGWTPVIFDDDSVLYLKRTDRFEDVIERYGITHTDPCLGKKEYNPPDEVEELRAIRVELLEYLKGPGGRAARGWKILGLVDTKLSENAGPGEGRELLNEAVTALRTSTGKIGDPRAFHALGVALARMGEPAASIESFERSLDAGSLDADNYLGIGLARYDLGDYGKAVRYLKEYVLKADDEARHPGYRVLGLACFKERDLGCAEAYLKRASFTAEDGSRLAESEYYLGNIALENGDLDEARRRYSGAVEADPKYAGVLRGLAGELEARGEKERAGIVLGVVSR